MKAIVPIVVSIAASFLATAIVVAVSRFIAHGRHPAEPARDQLELVLGPDPGDA
jgi:hypothetical protein